MATQAAANLLLGFAIATSLVAAPATAGEDRYDQSKMNFKSPPAVLSSERHTGPFSSGNALNILPPSENKSATPMPAVK